MPESRWWSWDGISVNHFGWRVLVIRRSVLGLAVVLLVLVGVVGWPIYQRSVHQTTH